MAAACLAVVLVVAGGAPLAPAATPSPQVDLFVTKTADAVSVAPGAPLRYTVTAGNHGPSGALEVVVVDHLPPEVAFVAVSDPRCGYAPDAHAVTCALGPMLADADAELAIDVTVAAAACDVAAGGLRNRAQVGNDEPPDSAPEETDPSNDEFTLETALDCPPPPPPPAPPDLAAVLVDRAGSGPGALEPTNLGIGNDYSYVFTVVNSGGTAGMVDTVQFTLPPARTVAVMGGDGCGPVVASARSQVVDCTGPGSVPPRGIAEVGLRVKIMTASPTTVEASAQVVRQPDLSDVEPTPVNGGPPTAGPIGAAGRRPIELQLTAEPVRAAISVGEETGLAFRLANLSRSTATGVRVSVAVPAGLSLTSGTSVWDVPELGAGAATVLPLTVRGDLAGGYVVAAEVVASDQDDVAATPADGLGPDAATTSVAVSTVLDAGRFAVAGRVFDDADGDRRADPGEAGLRGVGVELVDGNGTTVGAALTDADGRYTLPAAPAGYVVRLLGAGFVPTTPGARLVRAGAIDFGVRAQSVIPATGAESGTGAAAGIALIAFGAGLVVLSRRRETEHGG